MATYHLRNPGLVVKKMPGNTKVDAAQASLAADSAAAYQYPSPYSSPPGHAGLDVLSCLALEDTETAPFTAGDFEVAMPARHAFVPGQRSELQWAVDSATRGSARASVSSWSLPC